MIGEHEDEQMFKSTENIKLHVNINLQRVLVNLV